MKYKNAEMKLTALIGYFKDQTINLAPPFQRGRVWSLKDRKRLLENIVEGKPIPAIFLYKEAKGSKYTYNILDGKQRLESILLFIGDARSDVRIPKWRDYFFKEAGHGGFKIGISDPNGGSPKHLSFKDLGDDLVRDFGEYTIATIEIVLQEDGGPATSLDEVINLFIDINQQGRKVKRFDIVKAMMHDNDLAKQVFEMVAIKQRRGKDVYYKMKSSPFGSVLRRLQSVESRARQQERVDQIWERLLEIALFVKDGKHRTPPQILRLFLLGKEEISSRLTSAERGSLRKIFEFLRKVYSTTSVSTSKLARDQSHFYTMITSMHSADLISRYGMVTLSKKLLALASMLDKSKVAPKGLQGSLSDYLNLSAKQTTHVGRREKRQELFCKLLEGA